MPGHGARVQFFLDTRNIVQPFACACDPEGRGGGVVLRISSGGIDRRIFGGLRFRNFFGQENLASIFWGG